MGTDGTYNDKNYLFDEKDLSDVYDFYGLKSSTIIENDSAKDEVFNNISVKKELFSRNSEYSSLVPTTFEWYEGGNSIFVTGSFCQWKQFFLMKKESENTFSLTLNLPRGIHQYKFKVDGEWKYNPKFPVCNEGVFINNYIDTRKLEITIKNNDEGATALSTNITENYNDINKIPKKFSKHFLKANSELSQTEIHKDEQKEICNKVALVPIHYKNSMNINLISNQNKIGGKKYMEIKEKNILNDNLSYKNINIAPKEQINHLESKNVKNDLIISAVSSRYRFKYITFVYYKPK